MVKAIVATKQGAWKESLEVQEHPEDVFEISNDQVLISVKYAGLCFPNILVVEGKHAMSKPFPHVPTDEVAGIVEKVGSEVKNLKPGDFVFGTCLSGGLSEKAICAAENLYKVNPGPSGPNNESLKKLAGFEVNYGTTYHGLVHIGKVKKGEVVLVLGGSGGVGMACIDLAKALGCKVIAAASTDEKLKACKQQGADEVLNYSKEDLKTGLKRIGAYGKVDVVFDPVGGKFSEPALRSLAFHGRFLVIGFASGGANPKSGIPKIPLNLALLNEREILGVFWGPWRLRKGNGEKNRKAMEDMISMINEGKLNPTVSRVYNFTNYEGAFNEIMGRKVIGKVLIEPTFGSGKL
eukprot:maker-scaffold_52-snap-gene-0.2-mRNA-1 protein AED:0.01 eAED:0.01 QI:59/1/1/1/1/1/2/16/349